MILVDIIKKTMIYKAFIEPFWISQNLNNISKMINAVILDLLSVFSLVDFKTIK